MKRRIVLAALSSPFLSALAAGLGPNDYGHLDGVQVDPKTGAATLVLVIDRPLEDGLTKPKVRSKLLAYHQWVFVDRKLAQRFPNARPERGVRLLILHLAAKNALGTSTLGQIEAYARELQFEPVTRVAPTGS